MMSAICHPDQRSASDPVDALEHSLDGMADLESAEDFLDHLDELGTGPGMQALFIDDPEGAAGHLCLSGPTAEVEDEHAWVLGRGVHPKRDLGAERSAVELGVAVEIGGECRHVVEPGRDRHLNYP